MESSLGVDLAAGVLLLVGDVAELGGNEQLDRRNLLGGASENLLSGYVRRRDLNTGNDDLGVGVLDGLLEGSRVGVVDDDELGGGRDNGGSGTREDSDVESFLDSFRDNVGSDSSGSGDDDIGVGGHGLRESEEGQPCWWRAAWTQRAAEPQTTHKARSSGLRGRRGVRRDGGGRDESEEGRRETALPCDGSCTIQVEYDPPNKLWIARNTRSALPRSLKSDKSLTQRL